MTDYQKTLLYFLSGTGNTYRLTDWIAKTAQTKNIEAQILPLDKANPTADFEAGPQTLLGLLTPTHGFTASWAAICFALKLPRGKGTHAFSTATRAGTKFGKLHVPGFEGSAAYLLGLILLIKGYKLRAVRAFDMPSNWIALHPGFSRSNAESIINRTRPKAFAFAEKILSGQTDFGFWSWFVLLIGLLLIPISLGYLVIGRLMLSKLFFANHNCNNCGICAQNCPLNAIRMHGKPPYPYWTLNCESCMRCMNYCPQNAVEASWPLAAGFYYLSIIPAGVWLINQAASLLPFLQEATLQPILNGIIQYIFILLSACLAYFIFNRLLRFSPFNKLMTFTTPTHYYRRYTEPQTKLKDLR